VFGIFYFVTMITVYVIESLLDETWYTGIAINADARLKEHNAGKNRFTKGHRPWKIIYNETQDDWINAKKREKYLKTAAEKNWLRKWLSEHGGRRVPCLRDAVRQGFSA
jgi:putative endonuclease